MPDTPQNGAGRVETNQNTFFAFLQMIIVLAVVIALIWMFLRIIKAVSKGKAADSDAIRMLATKNLSAARSLHLVSVGKSVFLIGSGEGGVSLVTEIGEQEFKDAMFLEADRVELEAPKDFSKILADAFGLKPGKDKKGTETDFLSKQRDRLRKF